MALGNARSEDAAACRHFGAAVLAAIGLAVLLAVAPSADVDADPLTATHGHSVESAPGW